MTKRMPVGLFTLALFFVFEYIGLTLVFGAVNAVDFGVRQYTEVGVGMTFCGLSIALLATSLLVFLSSNNQQACRYLRWLGKWKPGS